MLKNGIGVTKNIDEGINYIRMAIEKGNEIAMYNYGLCFLEGDGVEKDSNQGIRYLKMAIDRGFIKGIDTYVEVMVLKQIYKKQ